ncbi:MAG TPA: hypothetical protein VHN14_36005 [Kofleriaceae bacterium]|jgi:hypothetical protein|nr:hypothetical protein [Kofleriaceae bacterium]
MRPRRHVRRPPDLTSLFDVLFIVVFAALIRATAVEHAAAHPPTPPRPSAPIIPPAVAALRQRALADLDAQLASRTPLVVRITKDSTIEAFEVDDKRIALDAPLLEYSPNPDVAIAYLGDRSADLHVCRIAALHLGTTELSRYLVIFAPALPLDDLPHALFEGLRRDLDRCLIEQHGRAALVDPAMLPPSAAPPPTGPRTTP